MVHGVRLFLRLGLAITILSGAMAGALKGRHRSGYRALFGLLTGSQYGRTLRERPASDLRRPGQCAKALGHTDRASSQNP